MSAHSFNLCEVLSETKRIINAHSRHFLALSVLFLLPLSFSLIAYPSLSHSPSPLSHHHESLFFFFFSTPHPQIPRISRSHLLTIGYALFLIIFSLCATASITHSTFHGFYGKPVKFVSSIRHVILSILPLIGTLIISNSVLGLIAFGFEGFTLLVFKAVALIGVVIDYNNVFIMGFIVLITALLTGLLIYLRIEWCLSNVIFVIESKWGLSALRRSSFLVRGMSLVEGMRRGQLKIIRRGVCRRRRRRKRKEEKEGGMFDGVEAGGEGMGLYNLGDGVGSVIAENEKKQLEEEEKALTGILKGGACVRVCAGVCALAL